jgi:hypothetical protein
MLRGGLAGVYRLFVWYVALTSRLNANYSRRLSCCIEARYMTAEAFAVESFLPPPPM